MNGRMDQSHSKGERSGMRTIKLGVIRLQEAGSESSKPLGGSAGAVAVKSQWHGDGHGGNDGGSGHLNRRAVSGWLGLFRELVPGDFKLQEIPGCWLAELHEGPLLAFEDR